GVATGRLAAGALRAHAAALPPLAAAGPGLLRVRVGCVCAGGGVADPARPARALDATGAAASERLQPRAARAGTAYRAGAARAGGRGAQGPARRAGHARGRQRLRRLAAALVRRPERQRAARERRAQRVTVVVQARDAGMGAVAGVRADRLAAVGLRRMDARRLLASKRAEIGDATATAAAAALAGGGATWLTCAPCWSPPRRDLANAPMPKRCCCTCSDSCAAGCSRMPTMRWIRTSRRPSRRWSRAVQPASRWPISPGGAASGRWSWK